MVSKLTNYIRSHRFKIILVVVIILIPLVWILVLRPANFKPGTTATTHEILKPAIQAPADQKWNVLNTTDETSLQQFSVSDALVGKPIPTNTWWLPALYSNVSNPIYVMPYSMKINQGKIEYGYSKKTVAQSDLIVQPHIAEFYLNIPGVTGTQLSGYHALGFNEDLIDDQKNIIANVSATKGFPFSFYNINTATIDIFNVIPNATLTKYNDNSYVYNVSGNYYLISSPSFKAVNVSEGKVEIQFNGNTNNTFSIGVMPNNSTTELFSQYAFTNILDSQISYTVNSEAQNVQTVYKLSTTANKPVLYGLIPNLNDALTEPHELMGTYTTLRGDMALYQLSQFTTQIATPQVLDQFPGDGLTPEQEIQLSQFYDKDFKAINFNQDGEYYAGKLLFEASNLLDVANYLDKYEPNTDHKGPILSQIEAEITNWATFDQGESSRYFEYDQARGGLIGITGEFDSQNFNDHHFHYGYFIYAFATVCKYDETFCNNYKGLFELMIKDVANTGDTSQFPYVRMFDLYEGHSWATGLNLTLDGNNQESVSEAINCWFAIYKLGTVLKDKTYQDLGMWLYSQEVNSSKYYWWNSHQRSDIFPQGYQYPYATLVWNGKVEVNTFFSTRPEARLGILVLPVSGGSLYLQDPIATAAIDKLNTDVGGTYLLFPDIINQYKLINHMDVPPVDQWQLDPVNSYAYSYLQFLYFRR